MSSLRLLLILSSLGLAAVARSEEKTSATVREEIKALVKEDAKNQAAKPATASPKTTKPSPLDPVSTSTLPPTPVPAAVADKNSPPPAKPETVAATLAKPTEPATTMPTVEVNKRKITVLDHELHEQDKQIAREAKNIKSTETDKALNSPALTVPILGGSSTKVRTGLAQERVELMEMEKDLTESIARAKTKEEKADLKKQLEDIRTMRRTLESPR